AEETGVINRKGAWYSYQGDNIAQGREKTIAYLENHPEFTNKIELQVRQELSAGAVVSANSVAAVEEQETEDGEEEE
ncbi:MAG: DNA recombination/repair protein RecA, partial [Okeania sp. SIO2H7]|nr:DNA recombination/repair protein RecA [Okeania sp. SIO2H7]